MIINIWRPEMVVDLPISQIIGNTLVSTCNANGGQNNNKPCVRLITYPLILTNIENIYTLNKGERNVKREI